MGGLDLVSVVLLSLINFEVGGGPRVSDGCGGGGAKWNWPLPMARPI